MSSNIHSSYMISAEDVLYKSYEPFASPLPALITGRLASAVGLERQRLAESAAMSDQDRNSLHNINTISTR